MQLTKLFLSKLGNEVTADSVRNALNLCNAEMIHSMSDFKDDDEILKVFFGNTFNPKYATTKFYK